MWFISPFVPIFFRPSDDIFGVNSKYTQKFATNDHILLEVLSSGTEAAPVLKLNDIRLGDSKILVWNSWQMNEKKILYYYVLTDLECGIYNVDIGDRKSEPFQIINDERELEKTTLIRYSMRNNRMRLDGVFWIDEVQYFFEFRVPGGFKDDDRKFSVDNEQFISPYGNIVEMFSMDSTQKVFTLGNSIGCPIWFGELLNRLLCCTHVYFDGVQFARKDSSIPEMSQGVAGIKSYIFKQTLQEVKDDLSVIFGEEGGGSSGGGGSGGGIDILRLVDDGREPTDNNVFSALRTLYEIKFYCEYYAKEYDKKYLRKDQDDKASGLIQFLKGITIGESIIDSLIAGSGIIAKDGRIQADRMELRSSLTVMELIFNRLSAMESDYSFSESGTIDSVELLVDNTYQLPLRKRWDNDFTALAENDVVYGVVNDLASGGGNYYTSWLRVLHVDTSSNTINAVMYPDSEVPGGKNYPPEPLMILSHRGNPVNEERQSYWYLSSREKCICMLDGVTKPILEEHNYAVIVGKLKQLSIFDNLPINYLHSYIYCRGIAIQDILRIDYQGVPIVQHNDRGFWTVTPDPAYSVSATSADTVWHVGCKWLCLINGTTDEPMYGSTGWAMIEGNPEFTIDIESSEGWNFDMDKIVRLYEDSQEPFTVLNVTGRIYNGDVTAHILDSDIEWKRDSGNVTEDNAWAVAHGNTGKVLALTLNDLGPHYSSMRRCTFIARALLRDGQKMRDDTYKVDF